MMIGINGISQRLIRNLVLLVPILLAATILTPKSNAQSTTANFRGAVFNNQGAAVQGVKVTLEHVSSKATKTTETNEAGQYAFNGLRVGGPYKLTAEKPELETKTSNDIFLKSGSNPPKMIYMGDVETITVSANRQLKSTNSKTYDEDDFRRTPSTSNDPRDIVKLSPDAIFDEDRMSIGGANHRFNSITVDGMRQDDDFGLNASGYPGQRSPISMMAIEEISVQKAPFDVRYGQFLGGNININTKTGGNEFEGGVSIAYSDEQLTGDKLEDSEFDTDFKNQTITAQISGPVIQDKLHFLFNVESFTSLSPSTTGAIGSGAVNAVDDVTQTDVNTAQEVSQRVYGFNAGSTGTDIDAEDLKFLGKLNWTINEDHRLELSYQKADMSTIEGGNPGRNLRLTSNWFDRVEKMDTAAVRLFSDWSYALSSRLEVSQKKVKSDVNPLEGNGFMQAEIDTEEGGTIVLGPERFRHSNRLENETTEIESEINYLAGDHLVTAGLEYTKIDIFNLFIANSNGRVFYDSLADFENQNPATIQYANAITGNPDDAAADFWYDTTVLYLQDEWQLSPELVAKVGLRGEVYGAQKNILLNENFVDRYGFANTSTVDGKSLLLPRLGLFYQPNNKQSFRGGFGLYSGLGPNVWQSNNYTNNGVNQSSTTVDSDDADITGFDGRNIPDSVSSRIVAGDGNVDALDPDFEIPHSLKMNFGGDIRFDIPEVVDNLVFEFDYTYNKVYKAIAYKDLRRRFDTEPVTIGPDGRKIYDTTPSSRDDGEFNSRRGYDMFLTNTGKGYGHNASVALNKSFSSGLSLRSSYAWQKVEDINPGTSSRAVSNYGVVAIGADPDNPSLARSDYERMHRFQLSASYETSFFDNLVSSISLYGERRSGRPFSYTFGGSSTTLGQLFGESSSISSRRRMLFYTPRGDGSDVEFDGINEAYFYETMKKKGLSKYAGSITPRNAFFGEWESELDLRLSQQLPAFGSNDRAFIILDVDNLPNLINNNWGRVATPGSLETIVNVDYNPETGKYIYSNLQDGNPANTSLERSIWKMRLTLAYSF